jgi:predicted DNA-binding transcriptional regulator AlpA
MTRTKKLATSVASFTAAESPKAPLPAKVCSPQECGRDVVAAEKPVQRDAAAATKGKAKWAGAAGPPGLDYIIRKPQLSRFVGLNMSVIYDMMARDLFPRPIKPNPQGRVIGWLSSEIAEWQRARAKERDEAQGDGCEPD